MNDVKFSKEELTNILHENASVEVKFTKKTTGEVRVLLCTLNREVLAQDGALKHADPDAPKRKTPEHLVVVYDLESSSWKSFDIATVFEVNV